MSKLLKKINVFLLLVYGTCMMVNLQAQPTPAFTLEDIFLNKKFEPKDIKGLSYINENEYLSLESFATEQYSVVRKWNRKNQTYTDIFDSRILKAETGLSNCIIDNYIQVDDDTWIVGQNTEKIYRYSEKAYYYVVKPSIKKVVAVLPGKKQMYPAVSPDGTQVAFVADNNIYLRHLSSLKLTQVTSDGAGGKIINGASDWVYEEEFGQTTAFEWSPDSKNIAYLRFDESAVKEMTLEYYNGGYPETYRFKYPRAGEENSKVSIHIYQLKKKKHIRLPVSDEYIPTIQWRGDGVLAFMHLPRFQNRLTVEAYDPVSKKQFKLYEESSEQYVELPVCFSFLSNHSLAITSEKNGFNHLYFIDKEGNETQITNGNFDISTVYYIHENEKLAYMQGYFNGPENLNIAAYHWAKNELHILSPPNGAASATFVSPHYYIEPILS